MTIWAAYANFEEKQKGSIELNKFADFVVLDKDIMKIPIEEVPNIKIHGTYIKRGESILVYRDDLYRSRNSRRIPG